MKILYIFQYFSTPQQSGSTRAYWIAQELLKHGHKVTMLTSDRKLDSCTGRFNVDGIDVVYLDVSYDSGSMGILQRFISFIKFAIKCIPVAMREKDVDLLISTSTPLTVGIPALFLKWFKKTPFIFEVRDLWPEVPIQMGGLKNKFLIKLAQWFEKTVYKNATHIVALSPGMYDGVISRNIPRNKVSMIPNMSKIDIFYPKEKNSTLMQQLGLKNNSFKVVYFGAMGIANDVNYIVDAAKILKNNDDIEFVFIGTGGTESILKERCKKENIINIKFLGTYPLNELSEIVNFCDVSLVTFLNLPILATNSPNKLFDSLSSGKPIIVNSPGWTKELVEDYNCGYFVDPENPKNLSEILLHLKNNPKLCLTMGENARMLAEQKYDKSILCKKFASIIDSIDIKA